MHSYVVSEIENQTTQNDIKAELLPLLCYNKYTDKKCTLFGISVLPLFGKIMHSYTVILIITIFIK